MTKVVQDASLLWVSDAWVDAPAELEFPTVSFLEIPFDHAVSHRPGTRLGPAAILDAFSGFSLYCTDKDTDLAHMRLCRLGAVDVVHDFATTYRRIRESVGETPETTHPIFLGGDHSVTDPIIRGLLDRRDGRHFGLIVFDAHFDSRPPVSGKEHSGHWMYTIANVFDHRNSVQLGINAPLYGAAYRRDAERDGVMIRTPYEIRRDGWSATLDAAIEHATRDVDGVYISVDIDCLDRAYAPGTSVPNIAGFLPHEVADGLFEIARRTEVIGLDTTEVSPPLDRDGQTAQLAALLVLHYMAGLAQRARSGAAETAGLAPHA